MTTVLEPLFRSPRFPLYVAELNEAWQREAAARKRFRDEISPSEKREFINGQLVSHSPARMADTNTRTLISRWLSAYVDRFQLGWVGDEKVLVALTRNDFEPDIVYFGLEKAMGLRPEQLEFPPPDLVVEVLSPNTESIDRGVKFEDYAFHGVREYWLADPGQEFIEQFELMDGRYTLRAKQHDGHLHGVVLPELVFPVRAAFDRAANLEALRSLTAA